MELESLGDVIKHLGNTLEAVRSGFALWKSIRGADATVEQTAEIDKLFEDAEKERRLALAAIGEAFGYQLCRCTLPPQVCLRTGYDRQTGEDKSKCPDCGQEYPLKLDSLDIPRPSYSP